MDVQLNDPDLDPTVAELLKDIDPELFKTSEGRRALSEFDPLMFAIIYLPEAVTNDAGQITFAECHSEWATLARRWSLPVTKAREHRYALLAPRQTGKSTFWFYILPMWMAAFHYTKFIAAFASRGEQALTHLGNFTAALKNPKNKALRQDFPGLVNHRKKTEGLYISRDGFTFTAQGVDNQTLGLKIGDQRPDTLLLDDIEPDESSYSPYLMEKRLKTLQDAVLPLNAMARVVLSGTTTMPNSITHQLVKYSKGYRAEDLEWVEMENFQVHHARPILTDDEGNERSFWPSNAIFNLEDMQKRRHTREFQKNFECDPLAIDAEYWTANDFHYDNFECTNTMISIDGAVTTGKKSDFTGIAVVGYAPAEPGQKMGRCLVKHAIGLKMKGSALREKVLQLIELFPETNGVLVETNQGGDMWLEVLHNLPVPVVTIHQTDKKETRAARALAFYQLGNPRVYHTGPLAALQEQMLSFPRVPNDDILDAVVTAVLAYLRPVKRAKARGRTLNPR